MKVLVDGSRAFAGEIFYLNTAFHNLVILFDRPAKVMLHLMFGVVSLFADQMIKLTGY